jgi:hypothetical protein
MKGHERKIKKEKEWKGLGKDWEVWSIATRTIF